jgi:peptidoglycan/xylan/chitin deacetylase (PgdA/CDA1 family)
MYRSDNVYTKNKQKELDIMNKRIILLTLVILFALVIISSASAAPMQTASKHPLHRVPHLIQKGQNNEQVQPQQLPTSAPNGISLASVNSNIVPNPSLETVSPSNSNLPQYWNKYSYGRKATFTYLSTGYTGSRSIKVQSSASRNVNAYWGFEPQPVTGGEQYEFSVMYKSNINPEVDAEVQLSNGETTWLYLGTLEPSTSWKKYSSKIFLPKDAVKATIYAGILSGGYLITDDYSLAIAPTHTAFNRPLVSITDDEAASSVYTNGYPLFEKYNLVGTFYLLSSELNQGGFMTKQQFNNFRNLGWEIGSHTVDHPYLTQITTTQLDNELKNSQIALSNNFGIPITDFASPYGVYNDQAITYIKKYYQSHRTTDNDFNGKDNFDPYKIQAFSIEENMDANYVKALIDKAIRDKTWLVLVYHDVQPTQNDAYTVTTENLDATLSYLKQNNVAVVTTNQALSEIKPQMKTPLT